MSLRLCGRILDESPGERLRSFHRWKPRCLPSSHSRMSSIHAHIPTPTAAVSPTQTSMLSGDYQIRRRGSRDRSQSSLVTLSSASFQFTATMSSPRVSPLSPTSCSRMAFHAIGLIGSASVSSSSSGTGTTSPFSRPSSDMASKSVVSRARSPSANPPTTTFWSPSATIITFGTATIANCIDSARTSPPMKTSYCA
ncbi:hypothetical protein C8R47DRAFT_1152095 [Mycena vitilis]|nr:hypothetical protein C8R47DRAFT_1152095 [Mycena vitilis]